MACSLESLHSAETSYGPWRCQHFPHSPLLVMLLLLPLWYHLTWGLSLDIPVRSELVWVCLCSGLRHASVPDGSVLGGFFLCHPYSHLLGDKEQVSEKGWVMGQDMVYRARAAKMVPKEEFHNALWNMQCVHRGERLRVHIGACHGQSCECMAMRRPYNNLRYCSSDVCHLYFQTRSLTCPAHTK